MCFVSSIYWPLLEACVNFSPPSDWQQPGSFLSGAVATVYGLLAKKRGLVFSIEILKTVSGAFSLKLLYSLSAVQSPLARRTTDSDIQSRRNGNLFLFSGRCMFPIDMEWINLPRICSKLLAVCIPIFWSLIWPAIFEVAHILYKWILG